MNIVYLRHTLSVKGGLERIFIDKINYLSQKPKYKVFVITYEQKNLPMAYPLAKNAKHIDLGFPFYELYKYNVLKRTYLLWRKKKKFHKVLQETFDQIKPDIILAATCDTMSTEALAKVNKAGGKTIIESHITKKGVERFFLIKGNIFIRLKNKITDIQLYRNIRVANAFVSLTMCDAKDWETIRPVIVIPNALTHYPLQLPEKRKEKKQVISVGRLTSQKGYDLLIEVWGKIHQQHPDWTLNIYGDGSEKNRLSKLVKEKGLEQVVFFRGVCHNIYEKYMRSDFYVMSSRWEGFGLVLAEAMSCGIPCVSFDCPHGPSDIIKDGEDGLLVENGNIEQLAEKISYLIENENIRLEMGRKARENIKRYLPENIMPQWEALFESLIKEK